MLTWHQRRLIISAPDVDHRGHQVSVQAAISVTVELPKSKYLHSELQFVPSEDVAKTSAALLPGSYKIVKV